MVNLYSFLGYTLININILYNSFSQSKISLTYMHDVDGDTINAGLKIPPASRNMKISELFTGIALLRQ